MLSACYPLDLFFRDARPAAPHAAPPHCFFAAGEVLVRRRQDGANTLGTPQHGPSDSVRPGLLSTKRDEADLARAAGCHPRSVRYWENKGSNPPTNVASTLDSIEQALNRHCVIPFSTPTPGVRCSN